jgi:hypothetical protein
MATPTTAKEQQLRADYMQQLYEASGRTNGLFTGLWHEHAFALATAARYQWGAQHAAAAPQASQTQASPAAGALPLTSAQAHALGLDQPPLELEPEAEALEQQLEG